MKTFEQMYSEFYGAEIDDAAQIQLYSHSGTELKDFVNYCIEQAGINPHVVRPALESVSEGEPLATEAGDTVAAGGDEKCTCPDDQCLLGDHPICRWKGFVRKSSEGQP